MSQLALVTTLDNDALEYTVQPDTTGQRLLEFVYSSFGLVNGANYFSLQFTDSTGHTAWLARDQKVLGQKKIKKESLLRFELRAPFYPKDAEEWNWIHLGSTTVKCARLLYLQAKSSIQSHEVDCPLGTLLELASFSLRAEYGDQEDLQDHRFFSQDYPVPDHVTQQNVMTSDEWVEGISKIYHGQHSGMSRKAAQVEYLRLAQDLPNFGVHYYPIRNRKGTNVWLGISSQGVGLYKWEEKHGAPAVTFSLAEIEKLTIKGCQSVIKPISQKMPWFEFSVATERVSECIVMLCQEMSGLDVSRGRWPHVGGVEVRYRLNQTQKKK